MVSTPPASARDDGSRTLAPVVVTATRIEQWSFDLPVSIDVLARDEIRQGQPQVNLSESLARIPGVVAQNRFNHAQDLQISSRGFGARSTFGVRGIRLYVDGIPATMPDGQGQVSHIDLGSAARIEVMRGPFSALYGNSAGGVIAVFTENAKPGLALQGDVAAGSFGTSRIGIKASGEQHRINYLVSAGRFDTDGYRRHSAAIRDTGNGRLRLPLTERTSLTIVGNLLRIGNADDPLGLTRAQFERDPRMADPVALQFNTRKSVDQQQIGLNVEHLLANGDSLQATVYGGQRSTMQVLAIPPGAQAAPTHAGGVIDLARRYTGIDLRYSRNANVANAPLQWTAGISYDNLDEDRRGYENFVGGTLGIAGRLRRDESNRVFNVDQYLQAQWEPDARWLLLAGVVNVTVLPVTAVPSVTM